MDRTSIEEVRNALQLCLRSLVAGCRFNIIGFGSWHAALFNECRAYDEGSLAEASAHVASMQADFGGTELLPALDFALKHPRAGTLPRQVLVLTDGQVTNTDAVIALAKKHSSDSRIFTFGIGAGSSHHLVKGLARAGGGAAEFIYPRERIEPKVVRLVGRLLSPSPSNVRLDWGNLDVRQVPSSVPQVFAGGRLLVYGFGKRPIGAPAAVRLTADSPSGPRAFEVPVDPARAVAGRTVCTLAARARIRELEESPEWTATRASRQVHRKPNAVAREIIALAIKYGLMSRETSYVAIERRDTPVVGDVQLRRVPTMLTDGWGGVGAAAVFLRAAVQPGFGASFTGAYRRLPIPMASEAEEGAALQLGAVPPPSLSIEESSFRVFSRRPREPARKVALLHRRARCTRSWRSSTPTGPGISPPNWRASWGDRWGISSPRSLARAAIRRTLAAHGPPRSPWCGSARAPGTWKTSGSCSGSRPAGGLTTARQCLPAPGPGSMWRQDS